MADLVRTLFLVLLLFLSSDRSVHAEIRPDGGAGGSGSGVENSPDLDLRKCVVTSPDALLARTYRIHDADGKNRPAEISSESYRPQEYNNTKSFGVSQSSYYTNIDRAPEGGHIVLKLKKAEGIDEKDWLKSGIYGVAETDEADDGKSRVSAVVVHMAVRERSKDAIVVDASMPSNPGRFLSEKWLIVPVLCGGESDNRVLGYATVRIVAVSIWQARTFAVMLILAFWALISYASWQFNRTKLDELWEHGHPIWKDASSQSKTSKNLWKVLTAANPIFISQDSLGYGSLERFQILIFTTVVGLVLFYIFFHSGIISDVSDTILMLLGVTVVGSAFARATGDWAGVSLHSRRWLVGTGILKPREKFDKPRWSDLFGTQGEVDVAKIQALLFTGLISIGILGSGLTGLGSFTLPQQIVYLSMISQGAFVAGKLVPAESRKRVEEDINALARAAADLRIISDQDATAKAAKQQEYEQARQAAKRTLDQTYVDRFDRDKFDEVTKDPTQVV